MRNIAPVDFNPNKLDRVQIVKEFLANNYEIKMNVFDPEKSFIVSKNEGQYTSLPTPIDISLHMESEGIRGCDSILRKILSSPNQINTFNPIHDYFNQLDKKWKGTSHIDILTSCVKVREWADKPEGHYQKRFDKLFKKWLVASVANYVGIQSNDVIFGFISAEGGIGKTRFFQNLVPQSLKQYYIQSDKEDRFFDINKAFVQNFLIGFEEFEGIKRNNIETLKKILSAKELPIKRTFIENLQRISNAVFTTNKNQEAGGFMHEGMNDRRFACVEILYIDYHRYNKEVNIEQVWAEALELMQNTDFNYTWNKEDWKDFLQYNLRYEKDTPSRKLIKEYYKVPENTEDEDMQVFMQPIEILQELRKHKKIPLSETRVSDITIGMALKALGYERQMKKVNGQPRYGYYVIPLF